MQNKLLLVLLAVSLAFTSNANATLIASDGFLTPANYAQDTELRGQNPTITGFSGAWTLTNNVNRYQTSSTSGISGFFNNGQLGGLTAVPGGTSTQVYRRTISENTVNTSITSGEYWSAHVMRVASLTNTGATVGYTVNDTEFKTGTFGIVDGTFVERGKSNNFSNVTTGPVVDTDYLFISQLSFTSTGSGSADTLKVWALTRAEFNAWDKNAASLDTASEARHSRTESSVLFNNGNPVRITEIAITYYNGNFNGSIQIDEPRIATSFEGLAIIPEPGSLALLGLAGLAALLGLRRRRN